MPAIQGSKGGVIKWGKNCKIGDRFFPLKVGQSSTVTEIHCLQQLSSRAHQNPSMRMNVNSRDTIHQLPWKIFGFLRIFAPTHCRSVGSKACSHSSAENFDSVFVDSKLTAVFDKGMYRLSYHGCILQFRLLSLCTSW